MKKVQPPFRLTFDSTRAKKYAMTHKEASDDAHHWLKTGTMKVCIQKLLPSGRYHTVGCVSRFGKRGGR